MEELDEISVELVKSALGRTETRAKEMRSRTTGRQEMTGMVIEEGNREVGEGTIMDTTKLGLPVEETT